MSLPISMKRLGLLGCRLGLGLLALSLPWLLGCGGSEPEPVESAPAAEADAEAAAMFFPGMEEGSQSQPSGGGGQAYGSGAYGGGASSQQAGYGDAMAMGGADMMLDPGG